MDGLCLTGEPCPAPRGRTARLPPGCLTAPVNPSQPQFDHPYDSPVNYRGRLGFSGEKGTLSRLSHSYPAGTLVPAPAVRCLRRGGRRPVPGPPGHTCPACPGRALPPPPPRRGAPLPPAPAVRSLRRGGRRPVPGPPGHTCPACPGGALPPHPPRTLRPAPAPGRPRGTIVDIYLPVTKVTIHDPLFCGARACILPPGLAGRPVPGRGAGRDASGNTAAALS